MLQSLRPEAEEKLAKNNVSEEVSGNNNKSVNQCTFCDYKSNYRNELDGHAHEAHFHRIGGLLEGVPEHGDILTPEEIRSRRGYVQDM